MAWIPIVQLILYPSAFAYCGTEHLGYWLEWILSFVHNTKGHGRGSGRKIEELLDIEDDAQEITMVYD